MKDLGENLNIEIKFNAGDIHKHPTCQGVIEELSMNFCKLYDKQFNIISNLKMFENDPYIDPRIFEMLYKLFDKMTDTHNNHILDEIRKVKRDGLRGKL
jgi:hypothetical protein